MLLPDVNVLVYAFRRESLDHDRHRSWLDSLVNGRSDFALSELVVSGVLRVVTNPRVFRTPTPPELAVEFVESIMSSPACRVLRPGDRHLGIFLDFVRSMQLRGNDVADAFHAALAIESGSEWVTADRGFSRFDGLRWHPPFID